ncbi:MAG TPA: DUF523 domain-containing protein [Pseudobdellovibrionaceae bacterium]|jgi:uncharacterized protein YbbK (DUF523 family)
MVDAKPKYLISACLVGCNCRYDGKNQRRQEMVDLYKTGEILALCPEELAKLGTPRPACEKNGEMVVTATGLDKSAAYALGAEQALTLAKQQQIQRAYLKSKSPMCGFGTIYDGSFSGTLKVGNGVLAELLLANGFEIESID